MNDPEIEGNIVDSNQTRINHFQSITGAARAHPAALTPKVEQPEKQTDTKQGEERNDMSEEMALKLIIVLRLVILELRDNREEPREKLSEIQWMQDGELKSSRLRLWWIVLEIEQSRVERMEE